MDQPLIFEAFREALVRYCNADEESVEKALIFFINAVGPTAEVTVEDMRWAAETLFHKRKA